MQPNHHAEPASPPEPGLTGMIGREDEFAQLHGFIALSTSPVAMLVEGEAGIGKTTLWEAGVAVAQSAGACVLVSRPVAAEATLSYAALGDLLNPVMDTVLPALPSPQRRALEAALLLREPEGPPPDERAIGMSLVTALHALSRSMPVVLAIDDVQWVDPASAEPLEFAVRRLGVGRIRILAAVRVENARSPGLRLDHALGNDGIARLRLGPLSLGAIHRIIRLRLNVALPRSVLIRVHEASAGNPFFALEIARAIVASGARLDAGRRVSIPDRLDGVLAARFAGLPPTATIILGAAATMSEPTIASLAAVVDVDREEVVRDLEVAEASGIVDLHDGRVGFAHPLLASSAYWQLDAAGRRRLHRRAATATSDVEEQARHLALATVGPDEEVATALDTAARHAASRGAKAAAAELAEMATGLTSADRRADLGRRRFYAAQRYVDVGDLGRARRILEDLLQELPAGTERVDVLVLLVETRQDDMAAQGDLLRMALPDAEADPFRSARVRRRLAESAAVRGDQASALAFARDAIAPAESSGDLELLVSTLAYVGLYETFLGTVSPGLLERAAALEADVGYLPAYESPRMVLGYRLLYRDQLDEARDCFEAARSSAAAHDDTSAHLTVLLHLAELEVLAGNWNRAAALAEEGLELAEELDADHSRAALLHVAAQVDALLGRLDEARTRATRGVELAHGSRSEVYEWLNGCVLGFVDLSIGDHGGAIAVLEPLLALGFASTPGGRTRLPVLIDALIGAGQLERAQEFVEVLEKAARGLDRPSAQAATARCRGSLLAAENDLPGALLAFDAALRVFARVDIPFEQARTHLALGQVQRRARRQQDARRSLQAALTTFERLGASVWADQARHELGRIGGRAPSAGVLTSSEEQVAVLVAEGFTNREAARSLHLSEHTVEGHLSRIYAKLGIRSRSELARHFVPDDRGQGHH